MLVLMRRLLLLAVCFVVTPVYSYALGLNDEVKISGYVVDNLSWISNSAVNGVQVRSKPWEHPLTSLLEPRNAASGYGLVLRSGTLTSIIYSLSYQFDATANSIVQAYLEARQAAGQLNDAFVVITLASIPVAAANDKTTLTNVAIVSGSYHYTASGYVMDNLCWSLGEGFDRVNVWTAPQDHNTRCLLKPICKDSGFGLVVNNGTAAAPHFILKYQLDPLSNVKMISHLNKQLALNHQTNNWVTIVGVPWYLGETVTLRDIEVISSSSSPPVLTVQGYAMDRLCWLRGIGFDGVNVRESPELHTVDCLNYWKCAETGYDLVMNNGTRGAPGYYLNYTLDSYSNTKMAAYLKELQLAGLPNDALLVVSGVPVYSANSTAVPGGVMMTAVSSILTDRFTSVSGYVMDNLCWDRVIGLDNVPVRTSPQDHHVKCLLLPQCITSGYALAVDTGKRTPTEPPYLLLFQLNNASDAMMVSYLSGLQSAGVNSKVLVSLLGSPVFDAVENADNITFAIQSFPQDTASTLQGYIMDKLCWSRGIGFDGVLVRESPQLHLIVCLLKADCVASSFGLVVNNGTTAAPMWHFKYSFDDQAVNNTVLPFLKNMLSVGLRDDVYVQVKAMATAGGVLSNVTALAVAISPQVIPTPLTYSVVLSVFDGEMLIKTKIDRVKGMLDVVMKGPASGWMALGVGQSGMVGSDVMFVYADAQGKIRVQDAMNKDRFGPVFDVDEGGGNNCYNVSGLVVDGLLEASFSRPLIASDSMDKAIQLVGDTAVIIARNKDTTSMSYHGASNRIVSAINFNTGVVSLTSDTSVFHVQTLHGITMAVTWGLLYPIGAIVARYFKHYSGWLILHTRLQTAGAFSSIMLAFVAFLTVEEQLSKVHHIIGLSLIFFLVLLVVSGYTIVLGMSGLQMRSRKLWVILHCWLSYITLLMAPMNMFYGLDILLFAQGFTNYHISLSTWICIYSCVAISLELQERIISSRVVDYENLKKMVKTERLIRFNQVTFNDRIQQGEMLLIVHGLVVDVKQLIFSHPGGQNGIKLSVGHDVSAIFAGKENFASLTNYKQNHVTNGNVYHRHSYHAVRQLRECVVGIMQKEKVDNFRPFSKSVFVSERSTPPEELLLAFRLFPLIHMQALTAGQKVADSTRWFVSLFYALCCSTAYSFRTEAITYWLSFTVPLSDIWSKGNNKKNLSVYCMPGEHYEFHYIDSNAGHVTRCYTPIVTSCSLLGELPLTKLDFSIKIQAEGRMGAIIQDMERGVMMKLYGPLGTSLLNNNSPTGCWKTMCMISAGSGAAPMLQLLGHHLLRSGRLKNLPSVYFDDAENDSDGAFEEDEDEQSKKTPRSRRAGGVKSFGEGKFNWLNELKARWEQQPNLQKWSKDEAEHNIYWVNCNTNEQNTLFKEEIDKISCMLSCQHAPMYTKEEEQELCAFKLHVLHVWNRQKHVVRGAFPNAHALHCASAVTDKSVLKKTMSISSTLPDLVQQECFRDCSYCASVRLHCNSRLSIELLRSFLPECADGEDREDLGEERLALDEKEHSVKKQGELEDVNEETVLLGRQREGGETSTTLSLFNPYMDPAFLAITPSDSPLKSAITKKKVTGSPVLSTLPLVFGSPSFSLSPSPSPPPSPPPPNPPASSHEDEVSMGKTPHRSRESRMHKLTFHPRRKSDMNKVAMELAPPRPAALSSETLMVVCGPAKFSDDVREMLLALNWSEENIICLSS